MHCTLAKGRGIYRACLIGAAVFCLAAFSCLAQRYSFREATAGLGNLNVNSIAQDRSGYLWVGTENGLYRYDGVQFRRFGAAEGLRARSIQSLFNGLDGTFWVGTTAGIYYERKDGSFAEVPSPAPVNQFSQRRGSVFTSFAPDRVVASDRNGVFLLRRMGAEQWVAEPMKLEGKAIWGVLYGPDGALWYGCDADLCRLADGKITHMRTVLNRASNRAERPPEDQWIRLLLDHNGHLWLRGYRHLAEFFIKEGRFELHDLPGPATTLPYLGLAEDAQGQIVAPQGPTFGLWGNGRWRMVTPENGLSHSDLSDLFVDREGSLWFGVVGHGLMRWVGQGQWESYTVAEGLSDDIVWATLRDRADRLWICTESGLDFMLAGEKTPRPWKAEGISTMRAVSLAQSADGAIWVGTAAGILVRIDPKTLAGREWKTPQIYRILADDSHRLWLATSGGLFVVDTAASNSRSLPTLVKDAAIKELTGRFSDLALDSAKQLWAASDQGLFRLNEKGWRRIDPGLSGVNPFQIVADRKGNLWVAGAFSGVLRLRVIDDRINEVEHFAHPPLLSEQVVALTVDHNGWQWIGQDAGVSIFDGNNWRSLTQNDGLIWNDIDSSALMEDKDGSMWIGTSGGLSHILAPQAVRFGPPPVPALTEMAYGAIPLTNDAQLRWNGSSLRISMSSLLFRDTRTTHLRYRLLGRDTEWKDTADKTLEYLRLAPGDYRFQVTAVDALSASQSPIAEISFRILPLWWQMLVVQILLGLSGSIVVIFLIQWGVRRRLRNKQMQASSARLQGDDRAIEESEKLRLRDEMLRFAEYDEVTGLLNHRMVFERLRGEVDRARRDGLMLSVILADLDQFKQVNMANGHAAGDQVLKEVASIILRSVRSYDWVGRYSGDEFLLVLPGSGPAAARYRAEQLRDAVQAARVRHGEDTLVVTASFGVASGFPSDEEELIQTVDRALHTAKEQGRNCVIALEIDPPDRFIAPQG